MSTSVHETEWCRIHYVDFGGESRPGFSLGCELFVGKVFRDTRTKVPVKLACEKPGD